MCIVINHKPKAKLLLYEYRELRFSLQKSIIENCNGSTIADIQNNLYTHAGDLICTKQELTEQVITTKRLIPTWYGRKKNHLEIEQITNNFYICIELYHSQLIKKFGYAYSNKKEKD